MKIEIDIDSTRRRDDCLSLISARVPELGLDYDLDLGFKHLYERCGVPDPVALDFLVVASLCYVIDKGISRGTAADNWTRSFEVEFPVAAPDVWNKIASDLEETLSFLTGDVWRLSFTQHENAIFKAPRRRRHRRRRRIVPMAGKPDAVCLFSGGLDSLAGAIDLLSEDEMRRVLLVGHYDAPGPRSHQKGLFDEIRRDYPRRAELLQTRVSHKPEIAQESTLRSRSLVFMALGVYAARSAGADAPLYAPENGLIAINVPLTPSRSGSCSTRTMHPFFLGRLRMVLGGLGLRNAIINPFQMKTKGECIVGCLNRPLLESLVARSVSCSHGTRRQRWVRREANNCGYCVPCLIRRAALHKAGLDDGLQYGVDVCAGELPIDDGADSSDDLRAMLDFLSQRRGVGEISREIRCVAPVENVAGHSEMVTRGFDEVRAFIHDKAQPVVRRAAGIAGLRR
jgi:7-cyano-7-deazaguanine synthase in queuosine biosynthesis